MQNLSVVRTDPIIVLIVIVSLIAAYFSASKTATRELPMADPAVVQSAPVPGTGHLAFEESFYDFGNVTEGDIVKHTFRFHNDGAETVRIAKTETSCGCTTAKGALKEYAPGLPGEMEVVVDTVGKKGVIVKTVTLTMTGNKSATAELSLTMNLIPPPHPKMEKLPNLNADARCKSCHLESAKGQTGIFLYHRVCAQCHGKKGVGASARALTDAKWQGTINDDYIRSRILDGWPERGMPSFVKGVTPPLDDEQVDTLVKYIREIGSKPKSGE